MSSEQHGGAAPGANQPHLYTGLDLHKRQGSNLVPPLLQIAGLKQVSWMHERLPDMLWCAILIAHFEREIVLDLFRDIAVMGKDRFVRGVKFSLGHVGISQLPSDLAEQVLEAVCEPPETREVLRALLLLEDLPARELWEQAIDQDPYLTDWEVLAEAVGQTLNQSSQEATDCRWAEVLFKVFGGQVHLRSQREVEALFRYPENEEGLGGLIRMMEGQENPLSPNTLRPLWVRSFWDQCLRDTPCEAVQTLEAAPVLEFEGLVGVVEAIRSELVRHADISMTTTDIDAKHDAVFGIAAYCLDLVRELLQMDARLGILGRTGLRTLLESYVTLAYLAHRDDLDTWLAYRNYGSGQAKLAFLKADVDTEKASFVDQQVLRMIANEDRWQEMLPINLAHWEKTNLRTMAEKAAVKDVYDRFYPWTSAFVHGNWAAIRNTEFDVCANPLHRLHRLVRDVTAPSDDVLPDGCILADLVLDIVDRLYPKFPSRLLGERNETA